MKGKINSLLTFTVSYSDSDPYHQLSLGSSTSLHFHLLQEKKGYINTTTRGHLSHSCFPNWLAKYIVAAAWNKAGDPLAIRTGSQTLQPVKWPKTKLPSKWVTSMTHMFEAYCHVLPWGQWGRVRPGGGGTQSSSPRILHGGYNTPKLTGNASPPKVDHGSEDLIADSLKGFSTLHSMQTQVPGL